MLEVEDQLFNKVYTHDCPGHDRVKYGVLNLSNDPAGIRACYGYGNSYFYLENSG